MKNVFLEMLILTSCSKRLLLPKNAVHNLSEQENYLIEILVRFEKFNRKLGINFLKMATKTFANSWW